MPAAALRRARRAAARRAPRSRSVAAMTDRAAERRLDLGLAREVVAQRGRDRRGGRVLAQAPLLLDHRVNLVAVLHVQVAGTLLEIHAFAVDHKANSSFFNSRLASIRGQDLPELCGLLHLEMRERAVRVRDLEVQLFVALGRLSHGFCHSSLGEQL